MKRTSRMVEGMTDHIRVERTADVQGIPINYNWDSTYLWSCFLMVGLVVGSEMCAEWSMSVTLIEMSVIYYW